MKEYIKNEKEKYRPISAIEYGKLIIDYISERIKLLELVSSLYKEIDILKQSRQEAWDAVIARDKEINITIKNLREELSKKNMI